MDENLSIFSIYLPVCVFEARVSDPDHMSEVLEGGVRQWRNGCL
jgi:hypothetical protein